MDQDIKIESVKSDCLAELKEEITIKEELFETNMDDSVEEKNTDIIKTEIKTESNEDYEIDLKSEILTVSCDPKLESQIHLNLLNLFMKEKSPFSNAISATNNFLTEAI
jgi:hypothetical protein